MVAVHRGAQRPRNGAHEVSDVRSDPVRRRSAKALDDAAALPRGLGASEQQLGAALRQIEKLLKQESLLKKRVLLLKQASASVG